MQQCFNFKCPNVAPCSSDDAPPGGAKDGPARLTPPVRIAFSGVQPGPGDRRQAEQSRVFCSLLVAQKRSTQKNQIRRAQRRVFYRQVKAAVTLNVLSFIVAFKEYFFLRTGSKAVDSLLESKWMTNEKLFTTRQEIEIFLDL